MSGRGNRAKSQPKSKANTSDPIQNMVKALENTVSSLNTTVIALNNTVSTLEKSVASQQKLISKLSAKIEEQEKQICEMKNNQKKHDKLRVLKFSGLTCKTPDGKAEVIQCIKKFLKIEVTNSDIVTRIITNGVSLTSASFPPLTREVPPSSNSEPETVPPTNKVSVLVSFINIWLRKKVFYAKKALKGTNIFVSEDLPKEEGRLFYLSRQLKKQGKLKETWTKELVVFIKTLQGEVKPIRSADDLQALGEYNPGSPPTPLTPKTPQHPQRSAPETRSSRRKAPQAVSGSQQEPEIISDADGSDAQQNEDSSSDGEYQEAQSEDST